MLFLGQSYPEKLCSISFEEVSGNPIPHQIEPRDRVRVSYNFGIGLG